MEQRADRPPQTVESNPFVATKNLRVNGQTSLRADKHSSTFDGVFGLLVPDEEIGAVFDQSLPEILNGFDQEFGSKLSGSLEAEVVRAGEVTGIEAVDGQHEIPVSGDSNSDRYSEKYGQGVQQYSYIVCNICSE